MPRWPMPSDTEAFAEETRTAMRHILTTRHSLPPPSSYLTYAGQAGALLSDLVDHLRYHTSLTAAETALTMFQHPCPWAATHTCPGLRLNRWLWYTAWAALRASVDAALPQGERPEAASRHHTCREEWYEHLPYLRRGGWRKPS